VSRSIFRFIIVGAVLAFAACPALAQQLRGEVRFADGNRPAFNVPVECDGANCNGYQYTDRNGKFLWKFWSHGDAGFSKSGGTGDVTITVRFPGYVTETRTVTFIDNNQSDYLFITLRPDSQAGSVAPPAVVNAGASAAARAAYEEGSKAVEAGKPEEGIPHLEKAVTLYPDYLEAHLALGTAYMNTKQWDKADASLRRALKLNPKSAEIYYALAELYRQQKKYPEAIKEAQEGLKLDDKSWQGHLALGRIYADQNDLVKAGPEVGKALEIKPDLAEGYLLAGNLHLKAHQPENALSEFQEYLRLDPNGKYAAQTRELVVKIKKALAEKKS
jgi:tetratricopeptide (TPR) repeat protein